MYFLGLGLKGFLVGLAWLIVPTTLLVTGVNYPLLGLVGAMVSRGGCFDVAVLATPMAASGRCVTVLRSRHVWRDYRRAHFPLHW